MISSQLFQIEMDGFDEPVEFRHLIPLLLPLFVRLCGWRGSQKTR